MKYFYSYYPIKDLEFEDIFFTILSIKLSSTLLRKMNKIVGIYSTKKIIELLKKYEVELDFYEDIEDEVKDVSSQKLFAVCKLYSNIIQTEPFIQIDTDLFLFDNFNFDLLESSPISFYFAENINGYSPYINYKNWKSDYLDLFNVLCKKFPTVVFEEHTNPLIAYNCAIVGGTDWKTISDLYKPIFKLIKDNKKYIELLGKNPMSVLEQHIITGILSKSGYSPLEINFVSENSLPLLHVSENESNFKIDGENSIIAPIIDGFFDYTDIELKDLMKNKFKGVFHLTFTRGMLCIKNLIYEMLKYYDSEYIIWLEKKFGKEFKFQKNKLNKLI